MRELKEAKLRELIRTLAADFFSRESNRTSLITVTRVELKSNSNGAVILFTVLPETQEKAALDFMQRNLREFRAYVADHARLMRVPFFEVAIDKGEKNRQNLEDISSGLSS